MNAHNISCKSETASNIDAWEYLGYITLRGNNFSKAGKLYVRLIGNKYFYKIVTDGAEYIVSLGNYTFQGETYNAQICNYYFNL